MADVDGLVQLVQSACRPGCIRLEDAATLDAFLKRATTDRMPVASKLLLILDYDLTLSTSSVSECHHMLRDAHAVPSGFRQDVQTLFDARDPSHPDYASIYRCESDPERPHRFWMYYNDLLIKHKITQGMIDDAVSEEKRKQRVHDGRLLREGVGDLLTLCDDARVPVVILSAGLEQAIRSAFAADGVPLPASCHVLTNRLVFDETGSCVAVEPTNPPASRSGKLRLLQALGHLARRSMVLMVGDKPVDASVVRGLPPLDGGEAGGGEPRAELAFGFFNHRTREHADPVEDLGEWQSAFHLLAHHGSDCTLAPVVALVRHLFSLAPAGPDGAPSTLLQVAASRAAAKRREPSLRDLNHLFEAEGMDTISQATYAAFYAWARANDVAMDDETYCDFCSSADSTVDTDPALHPAGQPEAIKGHAAAQGASSSVHQELDRR